MKFSSLVKRTFSLGRSTRARSLEPTTDPAVMERAITDEWFRSHFVYASDVVNEWLSKEVHVPSSRILDFGCGDGIMDLGMAVRHGAKEVIGADIHDAFKYLPETAKAQIGTDALPKSLRFETISPGESLASKGVVDAVFSWSVFEHLDNALLPRVLGDIFAVLRKRGVFFLQIEPLYFSPHGSHLSAIISEPWAHLIDTPDALIARIDRTQPEHMSDEHKNKTFEVCSFTDFKEFLKREYSSLNKLTCSELVRYVEEAGFEIEKKILGTVSHVPPDALLNRYAKEDLITNEVKLMLRRP
jgi:SAM-dependent methyltransferase